MNPPRVSIPRRGQGVQEVWSASLAQRGKTLFISSHILSELGEMCDTLLFIDGGKIVYHGASETLRRGEAHGNGDGKAVIHVHVAGTPDSAVQWATMNPGWKLLEQKRNAARFEIDVMDGAPAHAAALHKIVL